MVDLYYASYPAPPEAIVLDIDDTVDVVHGHQQLSLFNAHHDERCFLPIHIYDAATSRPVAVILRAGKTPSGREVRGHIRRLCRATSNQQPGLRARLRRDRPCRDVPRQQLLNRIGEAAASSSAATEELSASFSEI
jgi:hypothetical protein